MRWTSRAIWAALAPGPSRAEAIDHRVSPAWTVWVPWVRALGAGALAGAVAPADGACEARADGARTGAGGRRGGSAGRARFAPLAVASRWRLTGATRFRGAGAVVPTGPPMA